jgi:hypothetical protein
LAKKKEMYEDHLGNLSWKDSWLQNTVQLAALGGIVAGASSLAIKGDLGDAFRTGKSAFKPVGKVFDKYVKDRAGMPVKFGYQVFKNMYNNMRKLTPEERDVFERGFYGRVDNAVDKVDTDPEIQNRIWKEVERRFPTERERQKVRDRRNGTNNFSQTSDNEAIDQIYEQVRSEERDKLIYGNSNGGQRNNRNNRNNNTFNNHNNNRPLFDKRDLAQKFIASGVMGLGTGAGLTAFHYIDRLSKDPSSQQRLENTFQHAGSFLNPQKKDDDKKMDKQASVLGFYNAVKDAPKKLPEALFAGAGYTGLTLGTAKLLHGHDPRKTEPQANEEPASAGPRVIIELGNPTEEQQHAGMPLGLSGLPKLAGFRNFLNDFNGHEAEIGRLQNIHHADVAAEALKNENVEDLLHQQYGHLVNDKTQANFTNRLFESRAAQSKQEADERIRQLQEQEARAKLTVYGGGIGAAGLAGMGYAHHKKEQPNV